MDIPEMDDSRVCEAKRGIRRCLFDESFRFDLALTGAFACDKHEFDDTKHSVHHTHNKKLTATQFAVELKPIRENRL